MVLRQIPEFLARLYLIFIAPATLVDNDISVLSTPMCSLSDLNRPASVLDPAAEGHRPFLVAVEGNIGSGKSTFLDIFRNTPGVQIIPEPVQEWQNVNGTDLLDLMFHDGKRWAGVFQMETTLSRVKAAMRKPEDGTVPRVKIMERSLYSERYCFLERQHERGILSDPEYALMDQWFRFLTKQFESAVKPDLIVYLRADLPVLNQRIRKRGRKEEKNIDQQFIVDIQREYDDWLLYKNSSFPTPCPVYVMDANDEIHLFRRKVEQQRCGIFPQGMGLFNC